MATSEEKEEVYSVWALAPEQRGVRSCLKDLMSSLRSEFDGPEFQPHITVVGAMRLTPSEALRRFHSSCRELKPYTARVTAVNRGTFFYQCVFLLIDPTHEVVETSKHCCTHLDYKSDAAAYLPHLSLLYGDLSDADKEKAVRKVVDLEKSIVGLTFEVVELGLYKTGTEDKTLKSWEKIASFDLTHSPLTAK